MQQSTTLQNVRYNFVVNVADGMFFGLGLGFSSFAAVIPLFFATLTDNLVLIGLVGALHVIGWSLPQMLTAKYVTKLRRFKPFVLLMTLQERIPFFGLALIAWLSPNMDRNVALWIALALLVWQCFGGGFTGTAWQSMIGKIMPPNRRGTFYGMQSGLANLLLSGGAIVAGLILERVNGPLDFTLCFLLTGVVMMISFGFLASTRESESEINPVEVQQRVSWRSFGAILKKDVNFGWFLVSRCLSQVASMALTFYIIYATRHLAMDEGTAGVMVGVMGLTQTVGSIGLGWIGDQWGHRKVLVLGGILLAASALVATFAPNQTWFYLVFGLTGIANATTWATAMAMTIEFGKDSEKPFYIGVTNTVMAIPALAAPIIGGWLAETVGFQSTFIVSIVSGLAMAYVLFFVVRDPHPAAPKLTESTVECLDATA
jgi:MFS family permease